MKPKTVESQPHPAARRPLELRRALSAVRALMAEPERTEHVFDILDALTGDSEQRGVARLKAAVAGPRLLAERTNVLDLLRNRDALRAMPAGSLGRAYLDFMERENLSADGLVDASGSYTNKATESDLNWYNMRLRDTHDLWHVLTGYGRDGFGEVCVVAFSYAQTGNKGLAAISLFGAREAGRVIGLRRALLGALEGFRRGRAAAWLPAQDWQALLPLPLDTARQALGITPSTRYAPISDTALHQPQEQALAA